MLDFKGAGTKSSHEGGNEQLEMMLDATTLLQKYTPLSVGGKSHGVVHQTGMSTYILDARLLNEPFQLCPNLFTTAPIIRNSTIMEASLYFTYFHGTYVELHPFVVLLLI